MKNEKKNYTYISFKPKVNINNNNNKKKRKLNFPQQAKIINI